MLIVDHEGNVINRSGNLSGFTGVLDPSGFGEIKQFSSIEIDENASLRVLTVPLVVVNDDGTTLFRGHLQVARLLDSLETFNRVLLIALLIGLAAAIASLFVAVLLTPRLLKPLEDMAEVARQITRADDLGRRVPDTGRSDEIGDLARAFNQTLERLERLFTTQHRLLADVSHELRTPLTTVRGNIDLMRRMGMMDPSSMAAIQDEIERMTRLVGDLLLLARADSGGLPLHWRTVELDNVLFEVYRQVSLLDRGVEVVLTAVDQVKVNGDPDRLKQLILNLVDNAIKYTLAGGRVTLSLSKESGWASVVIADTGVGIPKDDLPHIFERFYRVDKARSRNQGGSGLGLSIAKWIADAHGAVLQVESEPNVGTTFTIKLPVLEEVQPNNEDDEDTIPTRRLRIPTTIMRRN
ncbi:MAG: ATP-binding protein [Chloroflexota bacterium]